MSDTEVLEELQNMEGRFVFECTHCGEIFETVVNIGVHSLERHAGMWVGIELISKQ